MPITRTTETIRPTQAEFGQIAYEVMNCVFGIHNEFGRFFDESVYKCELAQRLPAIELELPVTVSHGTFSKIYRLDVLAHKCALFEFKAAESLVPRHRGQTINYLLLFDLPHGKIINIRPERVCDEFVNCHLRLSALRNPSVHATEFEFSFAGASFFHDCLMSLIHDWGSGLETGLYEEALTHFLGGPERVLLPVQVKGGSGHLLDQTMRLCAPNVAFKITSFPERLEAFEVHAQRLLRHTALNAIHWVNITPRVLTFKTLR